MSRTVTKLNLADLLLKQFPPERFWINPYVPKRSIILVGAAAKSGKSFLMSSMVHAGLFGTPLFVPEPGNQSLRIPVGWNQPAAPTPFRTLIIDKELGEQTFQARMATILERDWTQNRTATEAAIRDRIFYHSKDSGGDNEAVLTFATREGKKAIIQLVNDVKPNLLILDPIGKMHHYDENSAEGIQRLYDDIEEVQAEGKSQDMSIIMTHHFSKPAKMNGSVVGDMLDPYNFRGSSKWFDLPDGLMMLHRRNVTVRTTSWWELDMRFKPRHGADMPDTRLSVNALGDCRIYTRQVLS